MITPSWIEALRALIDSANLDDAIIYIADVRPNRLERDFAPELDEVLRLRARCLICEVYDYAGRREDASACIEKEGLDLLQDLEGAKRDFEKGAWKKTWDSATALSHLKQKCWACLHLGMVAHYRTLDYGRARKRFELARDVLIHINNIKRHGIVAPAALARAYYCLGLVEREEHNLYDARKCFSDSIACAWSGIARKHPGHPCIPFLKYSIGRALGLGMAWIAYARAAMSEATAHIVGARVLFREVAGVKYLSSYVDVVHACCERSRTDDVELIEQAIKEMESAYDRLGGTEILNSGEGAGHLLYAQRAAYELSVAHVGASRAYKRMAQKLESELEDAQIEQDQSAQTENSTSGSDTALDGEQEINRLSQGIVGAKERCQAHLDAALEHINSVEKSLRWTDPKAKDKRTRCNVLIVKSRVFRERGNFDKALLEAKAALEIGENHLLSRIDCWITLGESYFHHNEHENALREFEKARNDRRAQTNPKILAVCDLQMALCYLRANQIDIAQRIFSEWESRGSQGRSNSFVRHLAEEVKRQLSEAAFVISGDVSDKQLQRMLDRAEEWLMDLAMRRHNNDYKKVAPLFGLGLRGFKEHRKSLKEKLSNPR